MNKRKFAAFDIDGTIYRDALYHDIVSELIDAGALPKERISEFSEKRRAWKTRQSEESFSDFVEAHVEFFESRLAEVSIKQYLEAVESLFERKKDYVHAYTRRLIKKLKAQDYFIFAISGSQIEIVEKFGKYYGFDDWVGQIHHREGDKFTGKSQKTYKDKEVFIKNMLSKHSLTLEGSIAVGDSIGDKGMLEKVEQPIAFNPEKKLYDHAIKQGWKIVIERKNVIYTLEEQNGRYLLAQANI